MDTLVNPNECYQYLQEAKSRNIQREPKEKLVEILKLYERNVDVLETVQIEMQIEGKLLMYGMTLPEVEDRLSEVIAEKMQLEDYLTHSGVSGEVKMESTTLTKEDSADIEKLWVDKMIPLNNIGVTDQHQILVLTSNNGLFDRPFSRRGVDSDRWEPLMKEISGWSEGSQKTWFFYIGLFCNLARQGYATSMYLCSDNKRKLIGLRVTETTATKSLGDETTRFLMDRYADFCRGDGSIKALEIYKSNYDEMPILVLNASIVMKKWLITVNNYATGFTCERRV